LDEEHRSEASGLNTNCGSVFVQWIPDDELREAGCQYRFTLFKLAQQPTVVSTTDYGCDV
jgi:hypothetical protein